MSFSAWSPYWQPGKRKLQARRNSQHTRMCGPKQSFRTISAQIQHPHFEYQEWVCSHNNKTLLFNISKNKQKILSLSPTVSLADKTTPSDASCMTDNLWFSSCAPVSVQLSAPGNAQAVRRVVLLGNLCRRVWSGWLIRLCRTGKLRNRWQARCQGVGKITTHTVGTD